MTNLEINYNCEKLPIIPDIILNPKKIIAFGDIHGDLKLAIKLLKLAKVVDDNLHWIGEDTIVVQVGDQIDKCRPIKKGDCQNKDYTIQDENSDYEILELFTELDKQARLRGGYVISLLGNHEIMNFNGNLNYVSYKGIINYSNKINPKTKELYSNEIIKYCDKMKLSKFEIGHRVRSYLFQNVYSKYMGCTRKAIIKIGGYLFVHGSITPVFSEIFPGNKGIIEFNKLIKNLLFGKINRDDQVKKTKYRVKHLLHSDFSPFWNRTTGTMPTNLPITNELCTKNIRQVFKNYTENENDYINGMIVGHTVQWDNDTGVGITFTCKGENLKKEKQFISRIDCGMSHDFSKFTNFNEKVRSINRKPHILVIEDNGKNVYIIRENEVINYDDI